MSRRAGEGLWAGGGIVALAACAVLLARPAFGCGGAAAHGDPRLRVSAYSADEIYRLKAHVGYQIDLEFEPGERFVGLGAGDLRSVGFAAEDNHLFLKPKAATVETNLTVLTTRRTYRFDYSASALRPDPALGDVIYSLRFTYPPAAADRAAAAVERRLASASEARPHNLGYAYRGSPQLKPVSVWDDGVQTRLAFAARSELPAIFVRNDDGTESLVNFTVDADELIVHRVARQFTVRRGRLKGCIVNEDFSGLGERLGSGTVAPAVERTVKGVRP
ncbi:MAG: conjugal transfer protein TrbG [Gammaproteobacteria bacterium]|nr:MAG: conjugal transfer protein TrbG [Gammaproteobacteria bacterium]